MADQAVCAQQAAKVFRIEKMSFLHNNPDEDAESISFTSHYNPALGHCFVEIHEGMDSRDRWTVTDAFEGAEVALYVAERNDHSDPKESRWMVPVICTVAGKHLKTYDEWEAAVIAAYGIQ
jgi:hypothetical protein